MQHLTAMSIDRIAIFYQNDAYGQAGLAGVERALKKRNLAARSRAAPSSATPCDGEEGGRRDLEGRSPRRS